MHFFIVLTNFVTALQRYKLSVLLLCILIVKCGESFSALLVKEAWMGVIII